METFTCAVCGIRTYKKRIRALPLQDFPFLQRESKPGSVCINLDTHHFVVVCLDCYETLLAQSTEYDRLGMPVHKRHFNWMALPPPPENSQESIVARLPSGQKKLSFETDLPELQANKRVSIPSCSPKPVEHQLPSAFSPVKNTTDFSKTSKKIVLNCSSQYAKVEEQNLQKLTKPSYPFTSAKTETSVYHTPTYVTSLTHYTTRHLKEMYIHKKRYWQVFVHRDDKTTTQF